MNTIVSISTAPGIGGIGIIRMSGEDCFNILNKFFRAKNQQNIEDIRGYSIKYGNIIDNEEIIDEVLVSYFKSPKSYTTENMCEINSHGGNIIINKILEICLKSGAELAQPGEFTKRAFLNGRIDLLQAESVIDIINAKSDREAKSGVKQLEGGLSNKIKNIKKNILDVMVNVEVAIDYPEYDVDEVTIEQLLGMLNNTEIELKKLEESFDNGKIIKDGIKTAIIGRPNVGKSSLLNSLLNEQRAIVTDIEGTTRDTIEEFISIKGIPIKLIDTAGIRKAKDEVERIGISRTKQIAKDADLIIAIFDSSKELYKEDEEILDIIRNKKSIIILNKIDLSSQTSDKDERLVQASNHIIRISALNNIGIEQLYDKIIELFNFNEINLDNEILITNLRHKNLISKAIENINKTKDTIENKMPLDIVSIFIRDILYNLNCITGEEVTDDIINEIFSKFCLGK